MNLFGGTLVPEGKLTEINSLSAHYINVEIKIEGFGVFGSPDDLDDQMFSFCPEDVMLKQSRSVLISASIGTQNTTRYNF
jgi:hypothetical protein